MPFYDLHCPACDKQHNIFATISAKVGKRIPCPDCGSFDLETVFSHAPAIIKSDNGGDNGGFCPNRSACGGGCPHGE